MFPYIYFLFSSCLPFSSSRAFFLLSFPPLFFFSFPSLLLIFFFLPSPSSPYALCFSSYFMFVVYCLASHFVMLLCVPTYCHVVTLHFSMSLHVPHLLLRTYHLSSKVLVDAPSSLLFRCLLLPCVSWYCTPFHVCR